MLHPEQKVLPFATARTLPLQGRSDRIYLVPAAEMECYRRDAVGLGCRCVWQGGEAYEVLQTGTGTMQTRVVTRCSSALAGQELGR